MKLDNSLIFDNAVNKPEQEHVENQKQEYRLVGTYLRTKGLKMYAYDSVKDELYQVSVIFEGDIHIVREDGVLKSKEIGYSKCDINTSHIHFEALNYKSALKRLNKFKAGKISELSNLKSPKSINIF